MATLPFLTSFNILMNISRNFLNFCVISDQMHVAIDLSLHFVIWKLLYILRIPLYDFNPALKNWSYVHVLIKIEPPKSLPHQSHCAQWPDLTSRETKVWLSQTPSEILIALSGFYNHTPVVIFRTLKSENLIGHTQNLITWTQEKKTQLCF